jgi:hypothetical protein
MNIMGLGDPVGFESLEEGRASQRKVAGLSFDAVGFGHGECIARDVSTCFRNTPAISTGLRKCSQMTSSLRRQVDCAARERHPASNSTAAGSEPSPTRMSTCTAFTSSAMSPSREGTFTGTHNGVLKGPMGEVPPTGRPIRIAYIQVLRFRDGKHVSFNLMFDRLSMLEQLGLIPAPHPRPCETPRPSSPDELCKALIPVKAEFMPDSLSGFRLTRHLSE